LGTSYTTHTLLGPSGPEVLEFLRGRGHAAFVSSGSDSYVIVLDAASDWQGPWALDLARDLSGEFICPVLAVLVHDDDVTYYELWSGGDRRDAYNSMPGFAGPSPNCLPEGGDAAELVRLMGRKGSDPGAVERVLRAAHGTNTPSEYLFERERHAALASALGFPRYAAGFGYRYLSRSISAGRPLSHDFNATGVSYHEPQFEISSIFPASEPSVQPASEADADIVVEITPSSALWRRRGAEDAIPVEADFGAQLRNAEHVSASSLVLLRLAADLTYQRVGQLLGSLHNAGFSRVIFGTLSKR
jgi:biopolymer transport protein ExbD